MKILQKVEIVFVSLLVSFIFVQKETIATETLSSEKVVMEFCQFDAEGKRLKSETWKEIKSLVNWLEEPGWDSVVLIVSYKIINIDKHQDNAVVTVEYRILGTTDTIEYLKERKTKRINFELVKQDNIWKITKPMIPPHVKKEFMIKYLNEVKKTESKRKKEIEVLLNKIAM